MQVDGDEEKLLEQIKAIKSAHPFWGYRRLTAWLRHREKLLVNQKRVRRLMKKHGLMTPQTVHKVKRRPLRNTPQADRLKTNLGY